MISFAVVEDSDEDAGRLKSYIDEALAELGESGTIVRFPTATAFLENYRAAYDLVFMDIELPDMDGMSAAKKLRRLDGNVILVFVTNMAQFAVNGYEVDAMDFMIKPVTYENLKLKLARALKRMENRREDKLVLQGKNGAVVVKVSELRYVEIVNHKLTFRTAEGRVSVSGSLARMEEKLKDYPFSRCNNCYLVNLKYVTAVEDFTVYVDGEPLPVSRSRKKPFLKDIADYLGGSI